MWIWCSAFPLEFPTQKKCILPLKLAHKISAKNRAFSFQECLGRKKNKSLLQSLWSLECQIKHFKVSNFCSRCWSNLQITFSFTMKLWRQWSQTPAQNTPTWAEDQYMGESHISAAKYSKEVQVQRRSRAQHSQPARCSGCWLWWEADNSLMDGTLPERLKQETTMVLWAHATAPQLCPAQLKGQKAPARDEGDSFQSLGSAARA